MTVMPPLPMGKSGTLAHGKGSGHGHALPIARAAKTVEKVSPSTIALGNFSLWAMVYLWVSIGRNQTPMMTMSHELSKDELIRHELVSNVRLKKLGNEQN